MVLRITFFDGQTRKQYLVKNNQQLRAFIYTLKLPSLVSFVVQNQRQIREDIKSRITMSLQQLLNYYRFNLQKDSQKRLLVSNVYVIRNFNPEQVLELNPSVIQKLTEKQMNGKSSRIVYSLSEDYLNTKALEDFYKTQKKIEVQSPIQQKDQNKGGYYKKSPKLEEALKFKDKEPSVLQTYQQPKITQLQVQNKTNQRTNVINRHTDNIIRAKTKPRIVEWHFTKDASKKNQGLNRSKYS